MEDCCGPQGNLKPTSLVLSYVQDDCTNTSSTQAVGSFDCEDFCPLPTSAKIIVITSNGSGGNPSVVFNDIVNVNESFVADAFGNTNNNKYGPLTVIEIFTKDEEGQDKLAQRVSFHTSCSQPLTGGDQYGGIILQGTYFSGGTCGILADWGDADDGYGTTSSANGPNHLLTTDAPHLGTTGPDVEADGMPDLLMALGDDNSADDEDGLVTTSIIIPQGGNAVLEIEYTNNSSETAYLCGWLDLNGNISFDDDTKVSFVVPPNSSGTVMLDFGPVTDPNLNQAFLRLRISTEASAVSSPTGPAPDGEVEDHLVSIQQTILPIELADFTASVIDDHQTELKWATLSELNSDYFQVERSINGISFATIGTVLSAGNSTQRIDYNLRDTDPVHGLNYYRLMIMDHDGSFEYSKVISVKLDYVVQEESVIFPNPVSDNLSLRLAEGASEDEVRIQVVDATGRLMQQVDISHSSRSNLNTDIELNDLQQGIYYLKVISAKRTEVLPFQKID